MKIKKGYFIIGAALLAAGAVVPGGTDAGAASDKVTWKLNGSTLTISGTGRMPEKMKFGKKKKTKKIKKVIIKNKITSISKRAFADCRKLQKVTIGKSVEKIANSAFVNTALKKVEIPNSVKFMGNNVFLGCKKLKEVSSPIGFHIYDAEGDEMNEKLNDTVLDTLTVTDDIGYPSQLNRCGFKTKKYVVSGDDPKYMSQDGAIYTKEDKELVYVSTDALAVKIADDCETIDLKAFVHDLGDDVTRACGQLKEIVVPETVKTIRPCYDDHMSMNEVKYSIKTERLDGKSLSALAEFIGLDKAESLLPAAFEEKNGMVVCGGTALYEGGNSYKWEEAETVTVPDGITEIPANYFSYARKLKEVVLPASLEKIGEDAFAECTALEKVNFPDGLKEIGGCAFYNTKIGACIPDKWQSSMSTFYSEYDPDAPSWSESHKNQGEIECDENDYSTSYLYDSSQGGKWIKLTMKRDGMLCMNMSESCALYNVSRKETKPFPVVKKGDVFFIQVPETVYEYAEYFKINSARVLPYNRETIEFGGGECMNMYYATGKGQYSEFEKEEDGGVTFRLVDYRMNGRLSDVTFEIQKKEDGRWISASPAQTAGEAHYWKRYTTGFYAVYQDFNLALEAGAYRVKFTAKENSIFSAECFEYEKTAVCSPLPARKAKSRALELYESDTDLESTDQFYREGRFMYSDGNKSWYKFEKVESTKGSLAFYHDSVTTGELAVTIYKKGVSRPVGKIVSGAEAGGAGDSAKGRCMKKYKYSGGKFKCVKTTSREHLNYSLGKTGTYYFKVERGNRKTSGTYRLTFNYAGRNSR